MQIKILEVKPIINKPPCLINGNKQDCHNCDLFDTNQCSSPRKLCLMPYPGHPNGCNRYGTRESCPPNAPLFDEVFDLTRPIYLIRSTAKNNDEAINNLYQAVKDFKLNHPGYYADLSAEAFAVDMTKTLEKYGEKIDWENKNAITRNAFLGTILNDKYIKLLD